MHWNVDHTLKILIILLPLSFTKRKTYTTDDDRMDDLDLTRHRWYLDTLRLISLTMSPFTS